MSSLATGHLKFSDRSDTAESRRRRPEYCGDEDVRADLWEARLHTVAWMRSGSRAVKWRIMLEKGRESNAYVLGAPHLS